MSKLFVNAFLAARNVIAANVAAGRSGFTVRGWPVNAAKGSAYTGINAILLTAQAELNGATTGFVGGGDAYDKGWSVVDGVIPLRYSGAFNGIAASLDAPEVDATTGEVLSAKKSARMLVFNVYNASDFGQKRAWAPDRAKGKTAQGCLTGVDRGTPEMVAAILIQLATGAEPEPTVMEVVAGQSVEGIAKMLSPRVCSAGAKLAASTLESCGFAICATPSPDGDKASANAVIKTTALSEAKAQMEASGEQISARRIEAIASKAIPKVIDNTKALAMATSTAAALAARKICTAW